MEPRCKECGLMHPPVPGGCPMAKEKKKLTESGIPEEKIRNFLNQLKSVILSKSSKIAKNPEKFFSEFLIKSLEQIDEIIGLL